MTGPMTNPKSYYKIDLVNDIMANHMPGPMTDTLTDLMTISMTGQNCDVRAVSHSWDVLYVN